MTPRDLRVKGPKKSKQGSHDWSRSSELEFIKRMDSTEARWMARMDNLSERVVTEQQAINGRISAVETTMSQKLDEHTKLLTTHMDNMSTEIHKSIGKVDESLVKVDARVRVLEQWRWVIVGGGLVALFILTNYLLKIWLP